MSNPDFDSLRELHDSVNELLYSPMTKHEIIHHGQEQLAHRVSEASLKMADSCAAAKELLLLAKDHLQHLQSTFRRISAADLHAGDQFAPYRLPRKQLKKAILKRLNSIKAIKNECLNVPENDENLTVVANLLEEVRSTIQSIVKSLSSLISMPAPEGKSNAFRLKLTRADSLIAWGRSENALSMKSAAKRLEAVEMVVEDLEAELEQMLRRLIRTRASLLNIITS